tara:strand:- start:1173 stop:1457 length:285 start_codon:yes stop_codon:yes gene_type:complete
MPKVVDVNENLPMSDPFLITKEFKSSNEFSQHIERLAHNSGSFIDAIVDYCSAKDIDVESVKKLLSPSLKEKIKAEAENLNLLKGGNKTYKLPI